MFRWLGWKLLDTPPRQLLGEVWLGLRRLAGGSKPRWVTVEAGPLQGHRLFLAAEAMPDWQAMQAGVHDAFLWEETAAEARPNRSPALVIWDVGAHFGYHALAFATLAGEGGKVVAFEPNESNHQRLTVNIQGNPDLAPRVVVRRHALADRDGTAQFRSAAGVDSGRTTNSFLAVAEPPLDDRAYDDYDRYEVPTRSIDSLIDAGECPVPDVVKIDVEGAESLVLAGGRKLLAQRGPRLLIEVHNVANMHRVQQLLDEAGYQTRILETAPLSPSRCFLSARRPSA